MESSAIGPVTTRERIQTIDIIRAFALFGVVVANFTVDNRGISPDEGRTGFWDQLAYWPIRFFVDDKAMATYCFLFGLGFAIQLVRAQERNAPVLSMFIRRLVSLFIIGIIALVLTDETIPHEYAIVGVFLLLFYKLPIKFLPGLALACILLGFARDLMINQKIMNKVVSTHFVTVDTALLNTYTGVYRINPAMVAVIVKKDGQLAVEAPFREFDLRAKSDSEFVRTDGSDGIFIFHKDSTGEIAQMIVKSIDGRVLYKQPKIHTDLQQALKMQLRKRSVINNAPVYSSYKEYVMSSATKIWGRFSNWSWNDFYWGGNQVMDNMQYIFSYFLIGLYVGRRRIFYNISSNHEFLKKVMWWGFPLGVIGMSVQLGIEAWNLTHGLHWSHYSALSRVWDQFSWSTGVMAMTFAYVAGLTLLLEKPDWKKRLSFLAPVGRMGFTNYLLQAALYVCILPCGLQLAGKIGPFYRLLISLPVYGLFIPLSRWWFKHFLMGPVEWLWRSATYWKWQPMRLRK